MAEIYTLETRRLKLRQWSRKDHAAFAALNADPRVMEFFPALLDDHESRVYANKVEALIAKQGWGFWALEVRDSGQFAGFAGLQRPGADLPFMPCVEIGWRLAHDHWGMGYATEAARTALNFAFEVLELDEVVSFTSVLNARSRRVMEKIHMLDSGQNFEHPLVPSGHVLREHVLYKINRERWSNLVIK